MRRLHVSGTAGGEACPALWQGPYIKHEVREGASMENRASLQLSFRLEPNKYIPFRIAL